MGENCQLAIRGNERCTYKVKCAKHHEEKSSRYEEFRRSNFDITKRIQEGGQRRTQQCVSKKKKSAPKSQACNFIGEVIAHSPTTQVGS
ncbi:MAG: hypothetical protein EBT02_17485 [Planctomycetia bacterium]|nr:hypothetical protein [Planctomycetia bacterium]